MTHAADLIRHARTLITEVSAQPASVPDDVIARRALSSAYYGLFHRLTTAGATPFAPGGDALRFQAARAFSHAAMRKVCDAYVRSPERPFPPSLEQLNPSKPDPRLTRVASTFALLQEGRYSADYDLSAAIQTAYAARLVSLAETALADFDAIQSLSETTTFLAALLLADRWTRRG